MSKKLFGIISILSSILLSAFNIKINGAIIGSSESNILSFLAILLLIGGIIILTSSERRKIESKIEQLVKAGISKEKINLIQEKIRDEYKIMPKETRKELYEEISDIMEKVKVDRVKVEGTYNLHRLAHNPEGLHLSSNINLLEADSKILNKYQQQGGRGTDRYIFDNSTGDMLGIAYHPAGNTKKFKWRVRF